LNPIYGISNIIDVGQASEVMVTVTLFVTLFNRYARR